MPFYGSDCISFSFHFSSLRPGFRAIRVAARLTHRRILVWHAADGHSIRASGHCRDRQFAIAGVFCQRISNQPHVLVPQHLRQDVQDEQDFFLPRKEDFIL